MPVVKSAFYASAIFESSMSA